MNILNLPQPIIGLSPMDGVTDAAYRLIQKRHGNPDVIFTEFTNVIGMRRGAERLYQDLLYSDEERPVIAQVFGNDPESYYHAAKVVAALGFDGIDINMGCPARNVAEKGSGAGLILQPEKAKEIVRLTRKGLQDYFQDRTLTGIEPDALAQINTQLQNLDPDYDNLFKDFTLSVKTRIGYSENVVTDWIKHLEEVSPDWISVHGRTLKQMYLGQADWEAIAEAVQTTDIPIFGNGDVKDSNDAVRMIAQTGVKGVLIGRASYGNPWIFSSKDQVKQGNKDITDYRPSLQEKIDVMLEHADLHWQIKGEKGFIQMRKNFGWYMKDFDGASELRARLVKVNTPEEAREVVKSILI